MATVEESAGAELIASKQHTLAEQGVIPAQLMLARMFLEGRESDRDIIRAYMWFCIATDELNRMNSNVKMSMNPAQLAEGTRRVREYFNRSREAGNSASNQTSSTERARKDA